MNISSIVVQTLPKYLDSVIENLKKSGVCDYHMHDEKGRIIITIENPQQRKKTRKKIKIKNYQTKVMRKASTQKTVKRKGKQRKVKEQW